MRCVGLKLGNVIGSDIWELQSIGMGSKPEVVGEI